MGTTVERSFEFEEEGVPQLAYICDSGERWLSINSDEQLDTTEIDPTVRSVVASHYVVRELRPRLHKNRTASRSLHHLEEDLDTAYSDTSQFRSD